MVCHLFQVIRYFNRLEEIFWKELVINGQQNGDNQNIIINRYQILNQLWYLDVSRTDWTYAVVN